METFRRICIKDWEIKDLNNNLLKVERGKEYITSKVSNDRVTVFSNFWVSVPVSVFAGEQKFT